MIADDLRVRGAAEVSIFTLDINEHERHSLMLEAACRALGQVDVVLFAAGSLPDQTRCERETTVLVREVMTNGLSPLALLNALAASLEGRYKSAIGVITSVAGDRGRPSNYVYGSAKSLVSTYCEGLSARLFSAGISITDIRPGFVDSPMTAGLELPRLLTSQPEKLAPQIVRAIERRRDVVYLPKYWALIMLCIRLIPRTLFKRLSL